MTILTRAQMDAIERDGEYGPDLDLIATARAYHDLRDAVLAWLEENPFPIDQARSLREVVARVERGTP